MKQIHREIIKKAGCDVLSPRYDDMKTITADVRRRLNSQKKALQKTIEKGWDGQSIIEDSIEKLERTLKVMSEQ